MNVFQMSGVLAVWVMSPLLKKKILYAMSPMDYTIYHAVLCAMVILVCAAAGTGVNENIMIQLPVMLLLIGGACMSVGGSFLLSSLIAAEDNPGEVLAVLDACSSILRYILGAMIFSGGLTYEKTAGVLLIGAGLALMR